MPWEEGTIPMDRCSGPFIGRSLSGRTPGAGKQGSKGSLRGKGSLRSVMGGEGFYSPGGGSHIRKKTRAQR